MKQFAFVPFLKTVSVIFSGLLNYVPLRTNLMQALWSQEEKS